MKLLPIVQTSGWTFTFQMFRYRSPLSFDNPFVYMWSYGDSISMNMQPMKPVRLHMASIIDRNRLPHNVLYVLQCYR